MTVSKTQILDAISFISRFGLAAVWIVAGAGKVGKTMVETQTIMAYEIFTYEWSLFLGKIIGPMEVAGGLVLLLGIFLKPAGKLSAVVLVLFMVGIGQA